MKKNDFNRIKKQEYILNIIDKTQTSYVVGTGIMPLIRAVPIIGDMISTGTEKVLNDFQSKKQLELIDCILQDDELITIEQVNDIEFIINFSKTVESIKRLATNDKVKYFGNLLRNGYLRNVRIDNNDFEEYSNIITELSYRELTYLAFFKQETKKMKSTYNIWDKFKQNFEIEFKVKRSEIDEIFTRLKRSGFIDEEFITEEGKVDDDKENIDEMEVYRYRFFLTKSFDKFHDMVLSIDNL